MTDYIDTIIGVQARIVDLTAIDAPLRVPEFVWILENPIPYKAKALAAIADPALTDTQKMIAGLSMQRLEGQYFLDYAENVFDLLENGSISPIVFSISVFPPRPWNTYWLKNYMKPEVRSLLQKMAGSPRLRVGTRSYILEDLLTGKAVDEE